MFLKQFLIVLIYFEFPIIFSLSFGKGNVGTNQTGIVLLYTRPTKQHRLMNTELLPVGVCSAFHPLFCGELDFELSHGTAFLQHLAIFNHLPLGVSCCF